MMFAKAGERLLTPLVTEEVAGPTDENHWSRVRRKDLQSHSTDLAKNGIGVTPLHKAAGSGNPAEVRRLLRVGANAQMIDRDGATALHHFANSPRIAASWEVVSALKRRNADVNLKDRRGRTPLSLAIEVTPIRQTDFAREVSTAGGAGDIARGIDAFCTHVIGGDSSNVRALLRARADPQESACACESPLIAACRRGDSEIVGLLLSARASPNTQTKSGVVGGEESRTALQLVAGMGNSDLMYVLLNSAASPNLTAGDGRPPLHIVSANGHGAAVQMLLQRRANLDTVAPDGSTALGAAMRSGHTAVFHELVLL
eukprot:TRINITY_DN54596_c0_g1_i1.p1 TRINITY_DN54596_c0_g1~~TRINITY_DN54596_c0_g1_i1.p1  ORF type:complete len:315 (-),score=44.92 TRINITY_DN54596_c0_g1_i1:106-1050(-)